MLYFRDKFNRILLINTIILMTAALMQNACLKAAVTQTPASEISPRATPNRATITKSPTTTKPFGLTPTEVPNIPTKITAASEVEEKSTADTPARTTEEKNSVDLVSPEIIIEYQRSGGFLGLDDHLTIAADGTASLARGNQYHKFELDQQTLQLIRQQLEQVEFSKLNLKYIPDNTCCDLIEYTLTYREHTVVTMDTAVPEGLQPILDLLNQIIDSY
jgi:hypothetical protein